MRIALITTAVAALALCACPDDDKTPSFDGGVGDVSDIGHDTSRDEPDDESPECLDQDDCGSNELCIDDECVDPEGLPCDDNDDCPDGYICFEEECTAD